MITERSVGEDLSLSAEETAIKTGQVNTETGLDCRMADGWLDPKYYDDLGNWTGPGQDPDWD